MLNVTAVHFYALMVWYLGQGKHHVYNSLHEVNY